MVIKNETVDAFKTQYRDVRGKGIPLQVRTYIHTEDSEDGPRSAYGKLGIPPPGVVQESNSADISGVARRPISISDETSSIVLAVGTIDKVSTRDLHASSYLTDGAGSDRIIAPKSSC